MKFYHHKTLIGLPLLHNKKKKNVKETRNRFSTETAPLWRFSLHPRHRFLWTFVDFDTTQHKIWIFAISSAVNTHNKPQICILYWNCTTMNHSTKLFENQTYHDVVVVIAVAIRVSIRANVTSLEVTSMRTLWCSLLYWIFAL